MNNRYTLAVIAALALAGCGSQVAPTGGATQSPATHGKSWMLPETKSEDLLYVATPGEDSSGHFVAVFSYPRGKQVGQLNVYASQLCSDPKGNIFVTQGSNTGDSTIVEYAHGGKEPIETLIDPYKGADGCSVDPATENLAVANTGGFDGTGTVLVYPQGSGTPAVYQSAFQAYYCGYDGSGDLFIDGYAFRHGREAYPVAELVKDASQFTPVKLKTHIEYPMGIQWDGTYLVLGKGTNNINNGRLHRYIVKENRLVFVSGVRLGVEANSFYIQGSTVIVPDGINDVWFLTYPGGAREKTISLNTARAVTVSVAPSGADAKRARIKH